VGDGLAVAANALALCPAPAALPFVVHALVKVLAAAVILKPTAEGMALVQQVGLLLVHLVHLSVAYGLRSQDAFETGLEQVEALGRLKARVELLASILASGDNSVVEVAAHSARTFKGANRVRVAAVSSYDLRELGVEFLSGHFVSLRA